MITFKKTLCGAALFFATTVPAMAQGLVVEVPEPNVAALLAFAAAGVFIGRRMSVRKPPQD